jgi:hypothetical protein
MTKLDTMINSYLECALWSSTDGEEATPMDQLYSFEDFAKTTLDHCREDCGTFLKLAGDLIEESEVSRAGHDFWLTRNGHGAGFWDGDWPMCGDALTTLSHGFGEIDLYSGDDGKLYLA